MANEIITKIKEACLKRENIDSPHDLDSSATSILGLLTELNMDEKYNDIATEAIFELSTTLETEVVESIDAYREAGNKNAPENKKEEYDKIVKKAVEQIRLDISAVLNAE